MKSSASWRRHLLQFRLVRFARDTRAFIRLVGDLRSTPAFDRSAYQSQRNRRFPSRFTAAFDYVAFGSRAGLAAGPLLIVPDGIAERRGPGFLATLRWSAQVRRAGFPRKTAHPLIDVGWYLRRHPAAASASGGVLGHYLKTGRQRGMTLGPWHRDGVDLVELGRAAVTHGVGPTDTQVADGGVQVAAVVLADAAGPFPTATVIELLSIPTARVCLVAPTDPTPTTRICLAAFASLDDRVQILPPGAGLADALTSAATWTIAEFYLVMPSPTLITNADVTALGSLMRSNARTMMAQPILLAPDDTIKSAGLIRLGAQLQPRLAGLALGDGVRLGDVELDSVSCDTFAMTKSVIGEISNIPGSPQMSPAELAVALCVRARAAGHTIRLASRATARLPTRSENEFTQEMSPGDLAPPRPPGSGLRWAIKSPHPAGLRGTSWGDYHFAHSLAGALERLGQYAVVDPLDSWYRESSRFDDVTLTLRGLHRFNPSPEQLNIVWTISHPELVSMAELADFDLCFAASRRWAEFHGTADHPVVTLLQCTDANAFGLPYTEPHVSLPILFVGNSRSTARPLVGAALAAGLDLAIYGSGWEGRVPADVVRGEFVANEELCALYQSAEVVLNDHWPEMAEWGFLSNRLFDLTAAGVNWVSDPAAGLFDVFPHARVAQTAQELRALVAAGTAGFPAMSERHEQSQAILRQHTFQARAATLLAAAEAKMATKP